MRPTAILSDEHRVMIRFLDTFGRLVDGIVRGRGTDPADLDAALGFLEEYGDAYHHVREENHLFDRLQCVGLHRGNAPVAFLTGEHRAGRHLLAAIRANRDGALAGERTAMRALAHLSRAFVDAEIDHIEKEDRILFPLADELLTPTDDRMILAGFEEVRRALGEGRIEELLGVAARLADRYRSADETAVGRSTESA